MFRLTPVVKDRLTTEGAAFGVGIVNGAIANWKPTASLVSTLLIGVGSMFGSVVTRGLPANILEGCAAGSFGSLGFSIPVWVSGKISKKGGQGALTDVKQLGGGNSGELALRESVGVGAGSSLEF